MADQPSRPSTLTSIQKQRFPIIMDKPQVSNRSAYNILGSLLTLLGLPTIATGGYFMMFGPRLVHYSRIGGPTFHQFLELYPGPILFAGLGVMVLARIAFAKGDMASTKLQLKAVQQALEANGIDADEIGDDYRLGLEEVANNKIAIALVDIVGHKADVSTTTGTE